MRNFCEFKSSNLEFAVCGELTTLVLGLVAVVAHESWRPFWSTTRLDKSGWSVLNGKKDRNGVCVLYQRRLIDRSTRAYQTPEFLFPYHDRFYYPHPTSLFLQEDFLKHLPLEDLNLFIQFLPQTNC